MNQTPMIRVVLSAIAGIALGCFVVFMVVVAVTTADNAQKIRDGQIANKSTFKLLTECVSPSTETEKHNCFERNQKNQAGILDYVKILNVASVACADREGTQTPEEILACVDRTMIKLGLPAPKD